MTKRWHGEGKAKTTRRQNEGKAKRRPYEASKVFILGCLRPSWAILGASGACFGPPWGYLGLLEAILDHFGGILGPFLGQLGAILGYLRQSWAILGASWDQELFRNLRPKITVARPRHLGPFWSPFWGPKFAFF